MNSVHKPPLITQFANSFVYGWRGIKATFSERNMRFHGVATIIVLGAGLFFPLTRIEWAVILLLIATIWSSEMINTALEDLANTMRDTLGVPYTGTTRARDISAGSVLILAIVAILVGCLIFGPHILQLLADN